MNLATSTRLMWPLQLRSQGEPRKSPLPRQFQACSSDSFWTLI